MQVIRIGLGFHKLILLGNWFSNIVLYWISNKIKYCGSQYQNLIYSIHFFEMGGSRDSPHTGYDSTTGLPLTQLANCSWSIKILIFNALSIEIFENKIIIILFSASWQVCYTTVVSSCSYPKSLLLYPPLSKLSTMLLCSFFLLPHSTVPSRTDTFFT